MSKTPGHIAYELDVALDPIADNGGPRKTWDELADHQRWAWNRSPTVTGRAIEAAVTELTRLRADLAKARELLAGIVHPADEIHKLYNTPEDSSWHDDLDAALKASARAIEAARAFLGDAS